jgi:hypothetical protein
LNLRWGRRQTKSATSGNKMQRMIRPSATHPN